MYYRAIGRDVLTMSIVTYEAKILEKVNALPAIAITCKSRLVFCDLKIFVGVTLSSLTKI